MLFKTNTCHQYGHPEFHIQADLEQVPEPHVQSFVQSLEQMVAEGSVFEPGQTFQVGWMVTHIESKGAALAIHEPDMASLPMDFVAGVTQTLRHKMLQLYTCDSFGLDRERITIPTLSQWAIACNRFEQAEGVHLARCTPDDATDSGWFIGCLDDDHDHNDVESLFALPLYDAVLKRPEALGWLYLPPGTDVLLEGGGRPRVLIDEKEQSIQPGSFVDEVLKARGL